MIGGMKPSSSERRPWTGLALHRLGGDDLHGVAELLAQPPAVAHQRAAGAEPGDERGDLVELLEDLRRRAVVVRVRVRLVAVLVRHVVRGVRAGHLERHRDRAVGALVAGRVDDLGAVHLQQLRALGRDVVGHDDLERVALARADHRERDAGVAGRRLEDRLAGRDRAALLGVLDQRPRDAVLDRAGRVVRLELGPDADARLGREPLELDERRVADRLDDVAVATAAGAVPQLLRHCFRKCSDFGSAGYSARNRSRPSAYAATHSRSGSTSPRTAHARRHRRLDVGPDAARDAAQQRRAVGRALLDRGPLERQLEHRGDDPQPQLRARAAARDARALGRRRRARAAGRASRAARRRRPRARRATSAPRSWRSERPVNEPRASGSACGVRSPAR